MTIDGNLSESEWRNAKELDNFLTVFPNDKSNPKYKTKIKYFSNQDGLYFGIINKCIGATGLMSLKAKIVSVS